VLYEVLVSFLSCSERKDSGGPCYKMKGVCPGGVLFFSYHAAFFFTHSFSHQVRLIAPAKDSSEADAAPTNGDDDEKEEAGQQKTVLCIHLQEASIHDTTADTAAISRSSTEGATSASAGHPPSQRGSRAMGESAFDTTTSANSTKEIRFRGYDTSLEYGEEDAEGLRIARRVPIIFTGTPDLWDLITIRLHHVGPPDVPKVDANVFVHTFAAALSPELARDLGHLVSCFTGGCVRARVRKSGPENTVRAELVPKLFAMLQLFKTPIPAVLSYHQGWKGRSPRRRRTSRRTRTLSRLARAGARKNPGRWVAPKNCLAPSPLEVFLSQRQVFFMPRQFLCVHL
jgi:hypothetical protein